MLVLLTLLAVSAFNTSSVQLRIIGNMQAKQDAQSAANQAIGQVLSSSDFSVNPAAVTAAPIAVDINQDGTSDYTVTVTPVCANSVTILNTELDITKDDDLKCFAGGHFGGGAGAGVYSNCSTSTWDIQAKAVDTTTSGTVTTVHQGVKRRVSRGTEDLFCK
jgi:Tfp pilus assembly protein PilX